MLMTRDSLSVLSLLEILYGLCKEYSSLLMDCQVSRARALFAALESISIVRELSIVPVLHGENGILSLVRCKVISRSPRGRSVMSGSGVTTVPATSCRW